MSTHRSDNLVYWAIWAFVVAFVVIIVATAIAAGREALASKTLSAPSADLGRMMKADPVRLGVGASGSDSIGAQNAVESILSDLPVSSPAPMRVPTALGLRKGSAMARIWAAKLCQTDFSRRPGSGVDSFPVHESDTASDAAQAAPGVFPPSHHKSKWACREIPNRADSAATAMQVSAVGGRDHA